MKLALPVPETLALPECARCGRPVDEIRSHASALTGEHVFIALCHGEQEVVRLNERELLEAVAGTFAFGKAFRAHLLGE